MDNGQHEFVEPQRKGGGRFEDQMDYKEAPIGSDSL